MLSPILFVEVVRKRIAQTIGAQPSEIFFTSGGTEADNMALFCSVRDLGVKRIITTTIEHHAVGHPVEFMVERGEVEAAYLSVNEHGDIDLNELEALLKQGPTFQLIAVGPHRSTTANPFLRETAVILHCHSGEDGSESKTECDYNEQSDEVKNVEKSSFEELENATNDLKDATNDLKDAVENLSITVDSFDRSLNDLSDSMNHGFDRLENTLDKIFEKLHETIA